MSSSQTLFTFIQLALPFILGIVGRYIAENKNINPKDGFLAGFFGNIIGIGILLSLKKRPTPFSSKEDYLIRYHIQNKGLRIILKIASILLLIMISMFFGLIDMKSRGANFVRPAFTLSWMFYSYILIFSRFSKYTIWGKEVHNNYNASIHDSKPKTPSPVHTKDLEEEEESVQTKTPKDSNPMQLKAYKLEDGRTLFVDDDGKVVDVSEVQEYTLEDGSKIYIKNGEVFSHDKQEKNKNEEIDDFNIPVETLLTAENAINLDLETTERKKPQKSFIEESTIPDNTEEKSNDRNNLPEQNSKVFIIAMIGFACIMLILYLVSESNNSNDTSVKQNKTQTSPPVNSQRFVSSTAKNNIARSQNTKPKEQTPVKKINSISSRERKNNELNSSVKDNLFLGNNYAEADLHNSAISQYSLGINTLKEYGLSNLSNENIKLLSELYFKRGMEKDRLMRDGKRSNGYPESSTYDRDMAIKVLDYLK